MEPTLFELDRYLARGLAVAAWSWRSPFRRRRVPLPARVTLIQDIPWQGKSDGVGGWECRPGQARRMRAALVPLFEMYRQQVEDLTDLMGYQAR